MQDQRARRQRGDGKEDYFNLTKGAATVVKPRNSLTKQTRNGAEEKPQSWLTERAMTRIWQRTKAPGSIYYRGGLCLTQGTW